MTDSHRVSQFVKVSACFAKYATDLPHACVAADVLAIAGGDTGRFLASVLKAVKPEKSLLYGFGVAVDPENAAFFSGSCHMLSDPIRNVDSRACTVVKYRRRVNVIFCREW